MNLILSSVMLSICCQQICNLQVISKTLTNAVRVVIEEVYARQVSTVNLFTSDERGESLQDFKTDLLSSAISRVAFRHESSAKFLSSVRRRRGNVFLIADFEGFENISKKLRREHFCFNGFYLIVLISGPISRIQDIFQHLWSLQIHNVNIMFEDKNQDILVLTFIPFKPRECNDLSPVVVNTFKDGKFINGTENFFPDKFRNLHNCPVQVSTSDGEDEPYVIANRLSNGSFHLHGSDINLLNTLSKALNFRTKYAFIGSVGYCFENGSAKGPLKVLMDNEADLSISNWWLKNGRLKFFDATISYNSENLIFLIPPGRFLSPVEKLAYPFQLGVWMMVIACFLIGVVVVFLVERSSISAQSFVFGTGVQSPYFNLFAGFIGENQTILPTRNFARFLLMTFLMYSLIIRTLYQGSYFKLINSTQRKQEVKSIGEMIAKDFTFYVPSSIADMFEGTTTISSRLIM